MKIIKNFLKKLKSSLIFSIESIPCFEMPLPSRPFGNKPLGNKEEYKYLYEKSKEETYPIIDKIEHDTGFSLNRKWFYDLALHTQVVKKKKKLNYSHGRLLYSYLCEYIKEYSSKEDNAVFIFETGTARGFSSVCMAKALLDMKKEGFILTLDCIAHNEKMFWNCIDDAGGPSTRKELLSKWEKELSKIIFFQGWSQHSLNKIGMSRINFAFLDGQHTKKEVMREFIYVYQKQKKGDVIVFDDVNEIFFSGVCKAVKEIENNFPYSVSWIKCNSERGYAIARKEI